MKRGLAALVAGLVCSALMSAVEARAGRAIEIETKAGCAFAKFTGEADGDEKTKTGFVGGIAVGIPMGSTLVLEPQILYAMKGTSYGTVTDPTIDGATYYGTFNQMFALDYIEMPVLVRARFGQGVVRPSVAAGPYVGWKVLEKFHLNGPGHNDLAAENDAGRALDLGYTGGAGLEFGPTKGMITLEARYSRSLTSIQKTEYGGDVRNNDLRVTLGWRQEWPKTFGAF